MSRRVIAIVALLTLGSASAREPIGLSVSSWGRQLGEWEVQPDGSVRYTSNPTPDGARIGPYTMETRASGPDPTRYAQIVELMAPGRAWIGKSLPCTDRMTDMPYGEVHWGNAKLAFDSGCRDKDTAAIVEGFHDADDRIEQWMKEAPVVATRTVK
jgi:hypothetical protein